MEDINTIKPLFEMDFPWLMFSSALALMLGMIIIFWLALMKLLSKRKPKEPVVQEAPAPTKLKATPEKWALQELKNLAKSGMIERQQSDQFYLSLDQIFKTYLGRCHHKPISSYTHAELSQYLNLLGQDGQAIVSHLQRSEQAKFAGFEIEAQQMTSDLQWIETFVKSKQAHKLAPL